MAKLKTLLVLIILIVLGIAALPLLVPATLLLDPVRDLATRITHQPVTIRDVSLAYTPYPALQIDDVTIGKAGDAHIARIEIPLTLRNAMGMGSRVADLKLTDATFSPEFARDLPKTLRPEADTPHLTGLQLVRASVVAGKTQFGPIDGRVNFNEQGELAEFVAANEQGNVNVLLQPRGGDRFTVQFDATGWELPFGYPVRLEFLRLKGSVGMDGLEIDDVRGDLYGGVVTGNAKLSWTDGNWQLTGTLRGSGVQAEPFSKVFSPTTFAAGRLEADIDFTYQADDYHKLFDAPQASAMVLLRDGKLNNFDLVTPLKSSTTVTYARGGITRFNTLSARAIVRDERMSFSDVKLDAGKFTAQGHLTILPKQELDGVFISRLQSGAISVGNRIQLAGQLSAPEYRTGRAIRPRRSDTPTTDSASEPAN
ncbi:hypothetical protein ACTSKR_06545 [Chitinibacteraceae bacterium HSL-7]